MLMCSELLTRSEDNPVSSPYPCEQQSKHWKLFTGVGAGGDRVRKPGAEGAARSGSSSAPRGKAGLSGVRGCGHRRGHTHMSGGYLQVRRPTSDHLHLTRTLQIPAGGTFNNQPLGGGKAPQSASPGTPEGTGSQDNVCFITAAHA